MQTRSRSRLHENLTQPLERTSRKVSKPALEACEPTAKEVAAAEAARARLAGFAAEGQVAQSTVKLPTGPEPVSVDVEYICSADLQPVSAPQTAAQACETGLSSKTWTDAIAALNTLRALVVHHPVAIRPSLARLVPLVLCSVKSLRSVQAKTAIMACCDLLIAFPDEMLSLLGADGMGSPGSCLLAQLLMKAASNDKRFVIDETNRACQTMAAQLDPSELARLLLPYIKHKNPKVRGKAGLVLLRSAQRLSSGELADAAPALMGASGALISDNTPDARTAAKQLVQLLWSSYTHAAPPAPPLRLGKENSADCSGALVAADNRPPKTRTAWESFVYASTSVSAAAAVLRVCNA